MSEVRFFHLVLAAVFVSGLATLITLLRRPAPYGRHAESGWGPTLPSALAWALMESPASVAFLLFFLRGPRSGDLVPLVLLVLWQSHYLTRALVDPWRMRARRSRTPVSIAAMGALYNVGNAYLNATSIVRFGPVLAPEWLSHPAALLGLVLFAGGQWTNRWADARLHALKEHSEGGYGLPRGGLYERVSCPNYLGEIVEWCGWALVTWSWAGLSFAVFTACNLVPRALSHHRWYRARFPEYPRTRRALVPGLL